MLQVKSARVPIGSERLALKLISRFAHLRASGRVSPDDLCVKGDARDRGSEHLNDQSGQRPKRDAAAGRWIVSCVGIIEAMALVSREDNICRGAVVFYRQNAKVAVAVLNTQLGAPKQCCPIGEIPRNVSGGKERHAVAIWSYLSLRSSADRPVISGAT